MRPRTRVTTSIRRKSSVGAYLRLRVPRRDTKPHSFPKPRWISPDLSLNSSFASLMNSRKNSSGEFSGIESSSRFQQKRQDFDGALLKSWASSFTLSMGEIAASVIWRISSRPKNSFNNASTAITPSESLSANDSKEAWRTWSGRGATISQTMAPSPSFPVHTRAVSK